MNISDWKKTVLGVLATIVLGAVGSGLWELFFKPLGQTIGEGILTAATLGSSAIKDTIYREAARGFHEASALQLHFLLTMSFWAVFSALLGYTSGTRSGSRESDEWFAELAAKPQVEQRALLDDRRKSLKASMVKFKKRLLLSFMFCMFLLGSAEGISFLKLEQANSVCTFFSQSLKICRPYITDQQARLLDSQFASMRGRADCIAIVGALRQVAASNHLSLPAFAPW